MAYAQPDGSLVLSEFFDNREVSDKIIKVYEDCYENAKPFTRERFKSRYDVE